MVLFDFPRDGVEYVRRVGRATRGANQPGRVTSLLLGRQVRSSGPCVRRERLGQAPSRAPKLSERTRPTHQPVCRFFGAGCLRAHADEAQPGARASQSAEGSTGSTASTAHNLATMRPYPLTCYSQPGGRGHRPRDTQRSSLRSRASLSAAMLLPCCIGWHSTTAHGCQPMPAHGGELSERHSKRRPARQSHAPPHRSTPWLSSGMGPSCVTSNCTAYRTVV